MFFQELTPVAIFVPEPEPVMVSDQVQEPATMSVSEGVLVESEGMPSILPSLKEFAV